MARRRIVRCKDIYRLRGDAWATHYENRNIARELSKQADAVRIMRDLIEYLPAPEMGIDGALLDYPIDLRREYLHGKILPESLSRLLCIWYWSEDCWMDMVRLYQSLPDVSEDYYWRYQPEPFDRVVLFPVSTNAPRGRSHRVLISSSPKVHLSYAPVDKPVDKAAVFRSPKVQIGGYRRFR